MSTTTIIPGTQYDALPYVSITQYLAESGDVEIVPGLIVRYFAPAQTGINGWAANMSDPKIPLAWMAYSLKMACRGCNRYTLTLVTKMRERSHDVSMPITVYSRAWVQAEAGVEVAPLQPVNPPAWSSCGQITLGVSDPGHVDPVLPPGNPGWPIWYKSGSCSWEIGDLGAGTDLQVGITGQMALRLYAPNGAGAVLSGFNAEIFASLLAST